jgi:hypothetical protein
VGEVVLADLAFFGDEPLAATGAVAATGKAAIDIADEL